MSAHAYGGRTAVVGIGATEFTKASGRSELHLAVEACVRACEDAGVDPRDVRGLTTFSMDNNPENELMRSLGIPELTHFSRISFGGGAPCGIVQYAALAVDAEARLPAWPDVPTLNELGFTGFRPSQWNAAFAPAGVPRRGGPRRVCGR